MGGRERQGGSWGEEVGEVGEEDLGRGRREGDVRRRGRKQEGVRGDK